VLDAADDLALVLLARSSTMLQDTQRKRDVVAVYGSRLVDEEAEKTNVLF